MPKIMEKNVLDSLRVRGPKRGLDHLLEYRVDDSDSQLTGDQYYDWVVAHNAVFEYQSMIGEAPCEQRCRKRDDYGQEESRNA